MNKKNIEMNEKFTNFSDDVKMKLLNIDETIFNMSRFKGIPKDTVINDIWNGKTNSQKRQILKNT